MTPDQPSDPDLQLLDLPRGRLAWTEEGQGLPLLAVHGLPGGVRDWRWLGPALSPGVRLLRVELPGLGRSDAALAPPTVAAQAALLDQACEALGLEKVAVLGHSFGSTIAVALATLHPQRVAGLALAAPVGLRPHRSFRDTPLKGFFAAALSLPGGPAVLGPLLRAAIVRFGFPRSTTAGDAVRTMQLVGRFSFSEHRQRVAAVRQPTLVAWTDDDAFIEADIVAELAGRLPDGPRLRWEAGGHNLQKSHAVELAAALSTFVRDLPAFGGGPTAGPG